eukprot:gene26490-32504_t
MPRESSWLLLLLVLHHVGYVLSADPVLLGSFQVYEGPSILDGIQRTYTCLEACELLFANATYTSYSGSTSGTEVDNKCYGDVYNKTCNEGTRKEDYAYPRGGNYDSPDDFSVYVNDH